jgi:hypothetical protein
VDYLKTYALWYLPVDQYVCNKDRYHESCEPSSGRKLLSVLSRDIGDPYNIVFLYRYESAYKEGYSCLYAKAFFQYHALRKTKDFERNFSEAVLRLDAKGKTGKRMTLDDLFAAFPRTCSDPYEDPTTHQALTDEERSLQDLALEVADATIRTTNLQLAEMVESEESSWNMDINVCKVGDLYGDKAKGAPSGTKEQPCDEYRQSLLERAVDMWALNWGPAKAGRDN